MSNVGPCDMKKSRTQRILFRLTALVFAAGLVLAATACDNSPPASQGGSPTAVAVESAEAPATSTAEVVAPEAVAIGGDVLVFGTVEPASNVGLSFARGGIVDELLVANGDKVTAGQPLARLRVPNSVLTIEAAEAALATAQAQLAEAAAGPSAEQIAVLDSAIAAAEAAVAAANANYGLLTQGPDAGAVAQAQALVAAAQADERLAQLNYDQVISEGRYGLPEEQARVQLDAATQSRVAAQAQLDSLVNYSADTEAWVGSASITQAGTLVDSARAQKELILAGPSEEALAVMEALVHEAEIALEIARQAAADAEAEALLVAPADGTVIAVNIAPGQPVETSDIAIELADLDHLQITATDLDELFIPGVEIGQKAEVTFEALPGITTTGTVSFISLRPMETQGDDEGASYEVIVTLDEPLEDLRWGLSAVVRILAD